MEKLDSWYHGPREGQPVWSAAGYLSESQGPLSWWFRQQAGEPDNDALAKLTLAQGAGKLPAAARGRLDRPSFKRFVCHYDLGKDRRGPA